MSSTKGDQPATAEEKLQIIATLQEYLKQLSASFTASPTSNHIDDFVSVQAGFGALEAAILPPEAVVNSIGFFYQLSIALGLVVELAFPEVLTTAGQGGTMSSKDIESRTNVPWAKASRLLRLMAGRGVFREVRPDVWAHTHTSRALDSGLPYETVVKAPLDRYNMGDNALPAHVHHMCSEVRVKAGAAMFEAFADERFRRSYDPTETAFAKAYGADGGWWAWVESEDGGARMRSFTRALGILGDVGFTSHFVWEG